MNDWQVISVSGPGANCGVKFLCRKGTVPLVVIGHEGECPLKLKAAALRDCKNVDTSALAVLMVSGEHMQPEAAYLPDEPALRIELKGMGKK